MPTDSNRPALADLPETGVIASLLGELRGLPAAVPRLPPRAAARTLRDFLAVVNWRNVKAKPRQPQSLGTPAARTLRDFLAAVNWRNVPRQEEAADFPSPLTIDRVLAEFVWD
jgi:hypothetical protein